jgi:hypothetical protein
MNNNIKHTNAFYFLTVTAFTIALIGMIIGIMRLEADIQTKGFFAVSYIFSVYTTFSLAKVIRDRAELK